MSTKYKKDDKVRQHKDSKFIQQSGARVGVIVEPSEPDEDRVGQWYRVRWTNGYSNHYPEDQLIAVADIELKVGDVVRNVTPGDSGIESPNIGKVGIVNKIHERDTYYVTYEDGSTGHGPLYCYEIVRKEGGPIDYF